MIMAFQAFDIVSVMTGGGPGRTTSIYVFYVWEQAFELFRTGYAAAAITVFFALILALTLLQYRWLGRKNATGDRL
jgi:multiple sugar transport system permease protein